MGKWLLIIAQSMILIFVKKDGHRPCKRFHKVLVYTCKQEKILLGKGSVLYV